MKKSEARTLLTSRLSSFADEVKLVLERKVGDSIDPKELAGMTEAEVDIIMLRWVQRIALETISEIGGQQAVVSYFDSGYSQICAYKDGPDDFQKRARPYDAFVAKLHGHKDEV